LFVNGLLLGEVLECKLPVRDALGSFIWRIEHFLVVGALVVDGLPALPDRDVEVEFGVRLGPFESQNQARVLLVDILRAVEFQLSQRHLFLLVLLRDGFQHENYVLLVIRLLLLVQIKDRTFVESFV